MVPTRSTRRPVARCGENANLVSEKQATRDDHLRIRARTQTALKNGVGFVLIGAVVGAIVSVADLDNFSLIVCLKCAAMGALIGTIVVAPIVIFEALFMQSPAGKRLQGLSFGAVTAVRSIIYVVFIRRIRG